MRVCPRCHIEKEEKLFRKQSKKCRECLRELKYDRKHDVHSRKGRKVSGILITNRLREKREDILLLEEYRKREKVFDRMRRQNTVYCFSCEVEIPCEEISHDWHVVVDGEYWDKINRLYGYHSRGGGKLVPVCNCCEMLFKRNEYDRKLMDKRRALQIQACERLGVSRGAIDKYPSLVYLKINQLFYHRKLKHLNIKT